MPCADAHIVRCLSAAGGTSSTIAAGLVFRREFLIVERSTLVEGVEDFVSQKFNRLACRDFGRGPKNTLLWRGVGAKHVY